MRCIEPGCEVRLARPDRASRCVAHSNAHKAHLMEGWQPSDETRRRMAQGSREREAARHGRPVITPEVVDEARRRRQAGALLQEVADWLGVNPRTVQRHLAKRKENACA